MVTRQVACRPSLRRRGWLLRWPDGVALYRRPLQDIRPLLFLEEYAKHAALNLDQTLQGMRYVYSHPAIDLQARRGSAKHAAMSCAVRSKRIVNDLLFAAIPPHWQHTQEELRAMTPVSIARWFQYGFCPTAGILSCEHARRFLVLASFSLRSAGRARPLGRVVAAYAPLRCSRKPRQNAELAGRGVLKRLAMVLPLAVYGDWTAQGRLDRRGQALGSALLGR